MRFYASVLMKIPIFSMNMPSICNYAPAFLCVVSICNKTITSNDSFLHFLENVGNWYKKYWENIS